MSWDGLQSDLLGYLQLEVLALEVQGEYLKGSAAASQFNLAVQQQWQNREITEIGAVGEDQMPTAIAVQYVSHGVGDAIGGGGCCHHLMKQGAARQKRFHRSASQEKNPIWGPGSTQLDGRGCRQQSERWAIKKL